MMNGNISSRLSLRLRMNSKIDYFVHDTAIVDDGAVIGKGTRIWHWSHIMAGALVGEACNIGEHAFIEGGVVIGNRVKIKNNVALYTGLTCEDDVFLGPNCVFTNVVTPRSFIERKNEFKKTIIRQGATIGANATIVCGNEIGRFAFVGAGSVVTRSVAPYALVIGNPAKFHAWVCECGHVLDNTLGCARCGRKYVLENGNLFDITAEISSGGGDDVLIATSGVGRVA